MDPNTLSMERGKEILKQFGIPQRDIDMMKEKWVVAACVEVLLQIPLRPEEDLEARCVSNRSQPSVDQPHTASQRQGNQEERKSINQFLKKTKQRTQELKKMADDYTQQKSQRTPTVQNLKTRQRGPMQKKIPPPSEIEDTRVICKNCGAFGHKMSSKNCPMKRWNGALAPQRLGSNKKKENLQPRKLQEPHTQESVSKIDKLKNQGQEQQKEMENIPCRFPRDQLTNYNFLRRPTMPMPVYTNKKKPASDSCLISESSIKSSGMSSCYPTQPLIKRPKLSSFLSPSDPGKGHKVTSAKSLLPSLKNSTLSAKITNKRPDACSHDLPHTLSQIFHSQAQVKCPDVNSKPIQDCEVNPSSQSSHIPDWPLRSAFTILDNREQSSRSRIDLTSVTHKKPRPPGQSLHVLQNSKEHYSHAIESVLFEDLLVSSSDESNCE